MAEPAGAGPQPGLGGGGKAADEVGNQDGEVPNLNILTCLLP